MEEIKINGGNALQLFTTNPRSLKITDNSKYLSESHLIKKYCKINKFAVIVHSPYAFNIAKPFLSGKKELEKGVVPAAKAAGEAFIKPAKEFYEQPTDINYSSQALRRMERGEAVPKFEAYKNTLKTSNPEEIASVTKALQSGQDKASQEYGRVLSQIEDATPREKESILFGLNQQPAFRDLVRKLKGE
jgi:hypothetical protein